MERCSTVCCSDYLEQYLDTVKNPFVEFPEEVEFDMWGSISLVSPNVTIAVGEIKPSLSSLQEATDQLVYRCLLLHWIIKTLLPIYTAHTLVGHIFVPRQNSDVDRAPVVGNAIVSFYVHRV